MLICIGESADMPKSIIVRITLSMVWLQLLDQGKYGTVVDAFKKPVPVVAVFGGCVLPRIVAGLILDRKLLVSDCSTFGNRESRCYVVERTPEIVHQVAENDPDPTRRKEMAHVIRRREILRKRQEGTLTPEEWEQWRRESRSP